MVDSPGMVLDAGWLRGWLLGLFALVSVLCCCRSAVAVHLLPAGVADATHECCERMSPGGEGGGGTTDQGDDSKGHHCPLCNQVWIKPTGLGDSGVGSGWVAGFAGPALVPAWWEGSALLMQARGGVVADWARAGLRRSGDTPVELHVLILS